MRLYEQLTSPELSNRLHRLGVTTPSVFWRDYTGSQANEVEWANDFQPYYCEDNVNAYSATELGEMLPKNLKPGGNWKTPITHSTVCQDVWINADKPVWACMYNSAYKLFHVEHAITEADARAKMLIYLLENKLVTAE